MNYKYNGKISMEKINFICENYPKLSINQISKLTRNSHQTISSILRFNNIQIYKNSSFRICHNLKWTQDLITQEALKYKYKVEFMTKSGGAYNAMLKRFNDKINDICKHMTPLGSLYKKRVYIYYFSDKSVYVGITQNLKRRHSQHKTKLLLGKTIIKYKATKLMSAENALFLENKYVNKAKSMGIKVHNLTKCTQLGGNAVKWTFEKCKAEALKYKTKSEWMKNSMSSYSISHRNKWFQECSKHMVDLRLMVIKNITTGETFDSIKDVCLKYKIYHTLIGNAIRKKHRAVGCYWEYASELKPGTTSYKIKDNTDDTIL